METTPGGGQTLPAVITVAPAKRHCQGFGVLTATGIAIAVVVAIMVCIVLAIWVSVPLCARRWRILDWGPSWSTGAPSLPLRRWRPGGETCSGWWCWPAVAPRRATPPSPHPMSPPRISRASCSLSLGTAETPYSSIGESRKTSPTLAPFITNPTTSSGRERRPPSTLHSTLATTQCRHARDGGTCPCAFRAATAPQTARPNSSPRLETITGKAI